MYIEQVLSRDPHWSVYHIGILVSESLVYLLVQ
jgi:hypothetical protein